tara:strand:+ start:5942 stop:6661 length:720 start_codon:yes stop_codon:yes gene_type:complete
MYFEIKIPEPCCENWHDMTPTEQGKFCANCEKEVIDFSNYTNSELATRLKNGEKLCGKFNASQLDREIFAPSEKRNTPWKLVASFTTLMAMAGGAYGQENPRKTKPDYPTELHPEKINVTEKPHAGNSPKVIDGLRVFEGVVIDHEGLPLPGATVILEGTEYETQTDFDGKYYLKVPIDILAEESKLSFHFVGFEPSYMPIKNYKYCSITMDYSISGQFEIEIHSKNNKKPRSRWMRWH